MAARNIEDALQGANAKTWLAQNRKLFVFARRKEQVGTDQAPHPRDPNYSPQV
jgi:hypothetical protein